MNGTKLRTILAIAISLNTALMATDLSGFENPQLDLAYKIISLILQFIIIAINTYFNNDYTPEAELGTSITRKLKEDHTLAVDLYDVSEDDDNDDDEDNEEEDEDDGDDDGKEIES